MRKRMIFIYVLRILLPVSFVEYQTEGAPMVEPVTLNGSGTSFPTPLIFPVNLVSILLEEYFFSKGMNYI